MNEPTRRYALFVGIVLLVLSSVGCFTQNKISLLGRFPQPLKKVHVAGSGDAQIAQIPVEGMISFEQASCVGTCKPSAVAAAVARLQLAASDPDIKAVVLVFDTPGGSVSASDALYDEIERFRQRTGKPVIAYMRSMCASGGVYAAMAADRIIANPTAITGSIGVIFQYANLVGLMDKAGVRFEAVVSGKHKDMGSPFRDVSSEERKMFQNMVMEMFSRFVDVVSKGRHLNRQDVLKIADGRIMTAKQALDAKLIDSIGSIYEAWAEAERLAGVGKGSSSLVAWRGYETHNETPYGPAAVGESKFSMQSLGDALAIKNMIQSLAPGFYYLWLPVLASY